MSYELNYTAMSYERDINELQKIHRINQTETIRKTHRINQIETVQT